MVKQIFLDNTFYLKQVVNFLQLDLILSLNWKTPLLYLIFLSLVSVTSKSLYNLVLKAQWFSNYLVTSQTKLVLKLKEKIILEITFTKQDKIIQYKVFLRLIFFGRIFNAKTSYSQHTPFKIFALVTYFNFIQFCMHIHSIELLER